MRHYHYSRDEEEFMMDKFLGLCHRTLFNAIKPVTKMFGKMHFPFTRKLLTGKDYYFIYSLLKPGVIFVTRTRGEFTTFLIPGFWKHAAMYTPHAGTPDELVTEAEGIGIIETDFISFFLRKDYVAILEPKFLGDKKDQIMKRASEIANEQLGKPYDFDFKFQISNNQAFYCSELVWWSYAQACMEFVVECPFVPRTKLGEETITPDDIALAESKFNLLWTNRKS